MVSPSEVTTVAKLCKAFDGAQRAPQLLLAVGEQHVLPQLVVYDGRVVVCAPHSTTGMLQRQSDKTESRVQLPDLPESRFQPTDAEVFDGHWVTAHPELARSKRRLCFWDPVRGATELITAQVHEYRGSVLRVVFTIPNVSLERLLHAPQVTGSFWTLAELLFRATREMGGETGLKWTVRLRTPWGDDLPRVVAAVGSIEMMPSPALLRRAIAAVAAERGVQLADNETREIMNSIFEAAMLSSYRGCIANVPQWLGRRLRLVDVGPGLIRGGVLPREAFAVLYPMDGRCTYVPLELWPGRELTCDMPERVRREMIAAITVALG